MNAPCKNCKERYLRCHSKCEKYITYREAQDRLCADRLRAQDRHNDFKAVRKGKGE